jgi:hypothetical protein
MSTKTKDEVIEEFRLALHAGDNEAAAALIAAIIEVFFDIRDHLGGIRGALEAMALSQAEARRAHRKDAGGGGSVNNWIDWQRASSPPSPPHPLDPWKPDPGDTGTLALLSTDDAARALLAAGVTDVERVVRKLGEAGIVLMRRG